MKFLKKYEFYLIILILILGLFLRLGLDHYMWIDETISASVAKTISETGTTTLPGGTEYNRAFLFHKAMSLFVDFGDRGIRFISVIFGLLTIFLAYLFSKKFLSKDFALVFPLLVAISTIEIFYSTQARMYQAFQFFYYLTFYLFYLYIKNKDYKFLIFTLISLYLTTHMHLLGFISIPLLAFMYFIYNPKTLKNYQYIILGAIFLISSIYLYMRLQNLLDFELALIYSSYYFFFLSSLFIIPLLGGIGMVRSLFDDYKLHLSLVMYTIIPIIGLFFIKYFATRYLYFAYFGFLFYAVYLISKLEYKWVVLILLIVLHSYSFGAQSPEMLYDNTMPGADYEAAFNYAIAYNESLVTSWSPAASWYGFNIDYQLNYSLSGTNYNFWSNKDNPGLDRWTGAKIVSSRSELPLSYVLVLDMQGKRKISSSFYEGCEVRTFRNVDVYKC
ncbi:MAG: glycosyltransferase family 39 protein [Candidatus Woesearchaeota archaeon]